MNGNVSWNCRFRRQQKCKSTLVTNPSDGGIIIKPPTPHSHFGVSASSEARAITADFKQAAMETQDPTRVIIANNTGEHYL